MEDFNPLDADFASKHPDFDGMFITEEMRELMLVTARWTQVLSYIAFTVTGLISIVYVFVLTNLRNSGNAAVSAAGIVGFTLLISVAYKIGSSLKNYSRKIRIANDSTDQAALETAYKNLALFYKIWAIVQVSIVVVTFVALYFTTSYFGWGGF